MKRVLMVLAMLLSVPAGFAIQPPPQFQINVERPRPRVQITVGMAQIHTHNANYRIAYLPLLAPLPYSYPRTTQEIPNPFAMTGTEFPYRPHQRH